MSLTSIRGGFELKTYSKYNGILAGRNIVPSTMNVAFTIRNKSGRAVENCGVSISWYYKTASGEGNVIASGNYVYGNSGASTAISWANGSDYLFSGSVGLIGNLYSSMYSTPTTNGTLQISDIRNYGIQITIVYKRYVISSATGKPVLTTMADHIRLNQEETDDWIPVWIDPFSPSIEVNAIRFDSVTKRINDEGENILVAVKLNKRGAFTATEMTNAGYPSKMKVTLASSATTVLNTATEVTLSECISGVYEFMLNANGTATARVTTPGIYTGTVSNASGWVLSVGFDDEYEPCYNSVEIPRSFANVHLSEFKNGSVEGLEEGGVCFGGFSKSADVGKALFESYYPSRLYGGIEQIGKKNADGSLWETFPLLEDLKDPSNPGDAGYLASGVTSPGTYGDTLQIRKIENKCIIKGSVMITPGSGTTTIAVLPEAYKPMMSTFRINACQGSRIARIAVGGTDGENYGQLVLSWVYNVGGSQFTGSSIWVDCSIEYWID